MDLENNENIETTSKLKKSNWFNRPTTLSKILTMILFICQICQILHIMEMTMMII